MAFESQRLLLGCRVCTPKSKNLLFFLLFFNKNSETMRPFLPLECCFRTPKSKDMVRSFGAV